MKYCTKCGTALEDGFDFCPVCGAKIVNSSAPACETCATKEEVIAPTNVEDCTTAKVEASCECTNTNSEVNETPNAEATAQNTNTSYDYYLKPVPAEGKGKCTAGVSLGFGLVSLLLFWIPGLNIFMFVLSILGIILAAAALKHYRYGAALAGKAFSILALIFNIILVGIFVVSVLMHFSAFEGFAAAVKMYTAHYTDLFNAVGKFLASLILVK